MKTCAASHHELYKKYQGLKEHKIFAIKKAIDKFYSVPLEEQDMEYAAWSAFLEVEEKFIEDKGNKTYQSFFIDCLYWKVKDYCMKFVNNKHKVCNLSSSTLNDLNLNHYVINVKDYELLRKLAIDDYIKTNGDNNKAKIVKLYKCDYSIDEICAEVKISKTKLYRIVKTIKNDLNQILEIKTTNI